MVMMMMMVMVMAVMMTDRYFITLLCVKRATGECSGALHSCALVSACVLCSTEPSAPTQCLSGVGARRLHVCFLGGKN